MTTRLTYELRTYEAVPGKLDALLERIRDHAMPLFEKHGMGNVGYWVETGEDGKPTETLVYLVTHASREAAEKSWAAFWADPDWLSTRGEQVVARASSRFLEPTDFSGLR